MKFQIGMPASSALGDRHQIQVFRDRSRVSILGQKRRPTRLQPPIRQKSVYEISDRNACVIRFRRSASNPSFPGSLSGFNSWAKAEADTTAAANTTKICL